MTAAIVDAHCHLFADLSPVGTDIATIAPELLPDVVVDAGTFGPENFEPFARRVQNMHDDERQGVFALVNVARRGLEMIPEIADQADFRSKAAAETAKCHADLVCGLKVRAIKPALDILGLDLISETVRAAEDSGLKVVVHFGQQDAQMMEADMRTAEILDLLRPGDVATHVYTGQPGGVFASEEALQAARRARARGVLFDVGHGGFNFDIHVARRAAELDFPPDLVSSDVTAHTSKWLSLPDAMAAAAAAGFLPDDIVRAVTTNALSWLGASIEGERRVVAVPDNRMRQDSHGHAYAGRYRFDFRHGAQT